MIYTFLGHQSWVFEENDTKILVDPLLLDTFISNLKYTKIYQRLTQKKSEYHDENENVSRCPRETF